MSHSLDWCLTPLPVYKLSQLVCLLLAVIFFLDGREQWTFYNLVFVGALVLAIGNFVTLLIHFFGISKNSNKGPWILAEKIWNLLGTVVCLLTVTVLAWDWWRMNNNQKQHHSRGFPVTVGKDGWMRKVVIVSIVSLITGILFLLTYLRVKRHGLQ